MAPHIFLGDHEVNEIDSALYQEAFFYGTVVHEKEIFKSPYPILHCCDYPPLFEEDLAIYLNSLEFPLPKDDLYKV